MKKIKEFLNTSDFRMNYQNNNLNILNYDEIILLTDTKILIKKDNKIITVSGYDLTLLKLLDFEILIHGNIKTIEL